MRLLTILTLLLCSPNSWAQTTTATDYLDIIQGLHANVNYTNMHYFRCTVHCQTPQEVENSRQELLQQIDQGLEAALQLPDFEGDSFMKEELITLLQTLQANCNGDYIEIGSNFLRPEDPVGNMENYYRLVEASERKLERANLRFRRAYNVFAGRNGIRIVEAEEESEIAYANRINAYYRDIKQLDFRLEKELTRILEALKVDSYRELEDARFNLERETKRVKYALSQLSAFDGDDSLRQAALRYTLVLQRWGDIHLPAFVSYLRQPTNEGVDPYNTALDFFNEEVLPASNHFLEAKDTFLKTHVPKPPKGQKRI